MNEIAPETLTVLPNPRMFRAARWTGRSCIGAAAIAILFGLAPLLEIKSGRPSDAVARGALPFLITGLWCGLSLLASEPERRGRAFTYARRIANLLALMSAAIVVFWMRAGISGTRPGLVFPPAGIGIGFVLLAIGVVLLDKRSRFLNGVVDVVACCLCLLLVVMLSGEMLRALGRPGVSGTAWRAAPVLACFAGLVLALTLRQAEHGVFSIFLGVGAGSRMARIFAPFLLLLPFAWEAIAARLSPGAPVQTALMVSIAVAVAISMLLFFAWRMSRMENQIHDLVLRDDATRLYNHRGFYMLAEHALRLARRSEAPFSVLFLHLENLGQIHAETGSEGSGTALAEAGEILRATFRESDIKGRIGADEFAVAGQFDRAGISIAAMRMEAATAMRVTKRRAPVPLKFSMGYVTSSDVVAPESLKEMLTRAGQMRHLQTAQLREMPVN